VDTIKMRVVVEKVSPVKRHTKAKRQEQGGTPSARRRCTFQRPLPDAKEGRHARWRSRAERWQPRAQPRRSGEPLPKPEKA
jgi:hypothetical protein